MANFGLGKGLSSLIPNRNNPITPPVGPSVNLENEAGEVLQIPVNSITLNPHQPRKSFEESGMQDLKESIKVHGIIQPLIVVKKTDGYELIAGERRLRAAQDLLLSTVPAIVKEVQDQQKLEIALIENIQREDLNPLEQAEAYKKLMDDFKLTQEEVARQVGKSRAQIANMIRILNLPEQIKDAIRNKKISFGHAKVILSLPNSETQLKYFEEIVKRGLSVRDLEQEVVKIRRPFQQKITQKDPELLSKEKELQELFGTKVNIKKIGAKGKIEISFYSDEEFSGLITKILDKK